MFNDTLSILFIHWFIGIIENVESFYLKLKIFTSSLSVKIDYLFLQWSFYNYKHDKAFSSIDMSVRKCEIFDI